MIWPFRRQSRNMSTLPALTDDAHEWGVAQGEFEGAPMIVRYNVSAREWMEHPKLNVKLGFAIPLNQPNPGGLPNPDENLQLQQIEDRILEELAAHATGIQALAITNGEMKEFIFYISEGADIASIHETLQTEITSHDVQCMAVREPAWDTYRDFASDQDAST